MARERDETRSIRLNEVTLRCLPSINWGALSQDQQFLTLSMVDFLFDDFRYGNQPAGQRVEAAQEKLPDIGKFVFNCKGWSVLERPETTGFNEGLEKTGIQIESAKKQDDLFMGAFATMVPEMFMRKVLCNIIGVDNPEEITLPDQESEDRDNVRRWFVTNLENAKKHVIPEDAPKPIKDILEQNYLVEEPIWPPQHSIHAENLPFWPLEKELKPIFQVAIPSKEMFYRAIRIKSGQEEDSQGELLKLLGGFSKPHEFNDSLFIRASTFFSGNPHLDNGQAGFRASTTIDLADQRIIQPDYGYYSYERVRVIRRALTELGIQSEFRQDVFNRNSLRLEEIGMGIKVDISFGSDSKEADEARKMWDFERSRLRGHGPEWFDLQQLANGLINNKIRLDLNAENSPSTSRRRFLPLESEETFSKQLDRYAQVLGCVISAFYLEDGVEIPKTPMTIEPFLPQNLSTP